MSVVMESWLPRHRFDVDAYYRMGEFGILKPNLRVELIEGQVKIPLFAHFGVPEVWIVDVVNERLHFYRSPCDGAYTEVSSTEKPGLVPLSALPDVNVDLSDLFG